MADQEEHNKTMAAWMRAVEALLSRMPDVTTDRIAEARDVLDQNFKFKHKSTWELTANLRPGEPLDEDASKVLDRIANGVTQRENSN